MKSVSVRGPLYITLVWVTAYVMAEHPSAYGGYNNCIHSAVRKTLTET
jgi:hypothetical protein